jgi:hypothetical protein
MTQLDDKGRPWAGDFNRQRIMEQRIRRIIDGKNPVDIAGALGTIMANMISDCAKTEADALRGLEQHTVDMREVVKARFAPKPSVN